MVKSGTRLDLPLAIVLNRDIEAERSELAGLLTAAAYQAVAKVITDLVEGRMRIGRPPSRVLRL